MLAGNERSTAMHTLFTNFMSCRKEMAEQKGTSYLVLLHGPGFVLWRSVSALLPKLTASLSFETAAAPTYHPSHRPRGVRRFGETKPLVLQSVRMYLTCYGVIVALVRTHWRGTRAA